MGRSDGAPGGAKDTKRKFSKPGANPGAKPFGKPGGKAFSKPGGKFGDKPEAKFGDKPGAKFGDKPGAKFGDKPGAKFGDKPGAKFGDKPGAKAGRKPYGRPPVVPGVAEGTKTESLFERKPLRKLTGAKPLGLPASNSGSASPTGRVGLPSAKRVGLPSATRVGQSSAKRVDATSSQATGHPRAPRIGAPSATRVGLPAAKSASLPSANPSAKPVARLDARLDTPRSESNERFPIRPMGRSGSRVAVRRPTAASSAMPGPALSPLTVAKGAWQPTAKWCQKELKQSKLMDGDILTAVQQFSTLVQAVIAATEPGPFKVAQREAAEYIRKHQFLRWAPLPSPLPNP